MNWDSDDPVGESKYGAFQASNTSFYFLIIMAIMMVNDAHLLTAVSLFGSIVFFSLSYAYATDGLNRRVWDRFFGDTA